MKKSFFMELDQREFNLLCDFMNGRTVDFMETFWRAKFMTDLRDYSIEFENVLKKWKVDKSQLLNKLESHTNVEFIELIISIDTFWGKDESDYYVLNLQYPENKINEILYDTESLEPFQWNPKEMQIEEFIDESKLFEYDFFVNVMDSEENLNSIWAINEEDLIGFMLQISNEGQFARIQRNDGFVKNEFISFLDRTA